jgi:hypothetical protein
MKNEFCTYEQALELAKLNFNEKCFGYYGIENKLHFEISSNLDSNLTRRNFLSAPLYQQAFRWFREKHNLCGEVYTVNMGAIDYTFQIRDLYSEDVKHNNFEAYTGGYIGTFLTYEEAEQACLDKLIEICKNK